ncbi:alpha/beta hydrolase [Falsiroseomonas tokyonensis]|uniref:Alpha/beta hydrolase n=1 Tax=Falsiroseomonas tokyonensis TaxID=430521 RepID=A0ABV7BS13_9PROT|nr:alpha/beta hydrolase [Falsiroseomonas tokyonensis]MBU8537821.1 alpha/beta hydrolase [Falsiroseomonas tokyonensis]
MSALPDFWATADQAARDAAYNNAEAVADSPALIVERDAAAEAFRAAHPQHLDLAYGEGEREAWDLFPGRDPAAPCLVFIHGGYWQRNRRENFSHLAEGALAMGWSVAFNGYTLAPEASLTTIAWQIQRALDWLSAQGPQNGIAGPLVASGWSAGGHLTALALEHPAVTAGLAISGIFELAPIRDTYLNAALKLSEAEIAELSPMRRPVVHKPLAVAYGSAELPELVRQSRDFHALRSAAHAPGPLVPIPGADHFRVLEALRQPGGSLLRLAETLLS